MCSRNVRYYINELQGAHLACKPEMPPYYSSASQKRSLDQWHPIRVLNLLDGVPAVATTRVHYCHK